MIKRVRTIRLPDKLVNDLIELSHLESLKRGADQSITWSGLLREVAEEFVRRERGREVVMVGR